MMLSTAANHPFEVNLDRGAANRILSEYIKENEDFLGVFVIFEPDAYDQIDALFVDEPGHDETGRFVANWTRDSANKPSLNPRSGYREKDSFYTKVRESGNEIVTDPYFYPI